MGRVMYIECASGAAGDMLLGALIDAGLPVDALERALGSLRVNHHLKVSRVLRSGVGATRFEVSGRSGDHDHHHHNGHDQGAAGHGHRSLKDIAQLIGQSDLSAAAKSRAIALFTRLAEVEAAIHQMPVDAVHLHEVGALDSIIDIAGFVFAMDWFGIDDVVSSPLNLGGGTVEIAHGQVPVPAPATVQLLTGVPVYGRGPQVELVTPTGALLVSAYAKSYGPLPPMRIERSGYGAGQRDFERVPNVLRVFLGERVLLSGTMPSGSPDAAIGNESIVKIECEIDDMNPQLFGSTTDRLFEAGALDVFLTPVQMKKGRPGTLLTVLADDETRAAVTEVIFRETTTLGVRVQRAWRETLDRLVVNVPTKDGVVRVKVSGRHNETFNAVPEFDDCLRIAKATGRPVKDVQSDALRAWHEGRERKLGRLTIE